MNKMNNPSEINSFFESYIDWITELFPELPVGHPMKGSEADKLIEHEYAIFKSDMLSDDILKLSDNPDIPKYYLEFLSEYSYRNLEVPLFSFPSTHPEDGLREIKSDIGRYIEYGLVPFVYDKSGTGYYSIDLRQEEAVVFYKNDERPSLTVRNKKLASSFLSVLIFLKEYLDWGGNISGLDDEYKPEALAELKGIDSQIGAVWEDWWLPRLLFNA
ncbi:hypothetical protein K6Y31_19635 [Motilimonas cestriensis]|uniref:Knr4/Smi1-like domain-containing protein n=1 Tax=Motilimonas cestriensis TaxID=2742685 RepID=A0ABS8WD72_9GAMM|nr:hypothetical protein [Motilimonas cestriensis]MCE2596992.1 hypothetical protein [Motilimonas cestriensis]